MSSILNTSSLSVAAVFVVLVIRIAQRFYYFLKGHKTYPQSFSQREALETFIKDNNIPVKNEVAISSDNVKLKYRVLGKGPKKIYLANGVGTDLFMWLPILRNLLQLNDKLFDEITLYAPSYRGIFGCLLKGVSNDDKYLANDDHNVNTTIKRCGQDVIEILKHAKIDKLDTVICWSLGAQMSLSCFAKNIDKVNRIVLLNPATGNTLHYLLQPFIPFPFIVRDFISHLTRQILQTLKSIIHTELWDILKTMFESYSFYLFLEGLSFFGGFPPEQASFFQEYLRDVFSSRYHTRGLMDLILSLDASCSSKALSLPHPTLIMSGLPDFMTGYYLAENINKNMNKSSHTVYTMASHFLLIEWPELVAQEMIPYLL